MRADLHLMMMVADTFRLENPTLRTMSSIIDAFCKHLHSYAVDEEYRAAEFYDVLRCRHAVRDALALLMLDVAILRNQPGLIV
jgi:hypothetical protein